MKNILIAIYALGLLLSCNKDEKIFEVLASKENMTLTPISGGAMLKYILPNDDRVMGIKVRYVNAQGKESLIVGSSASSTLVLPGFDEAVKDVSAKITLYDINNHESEPIDVVFSTLDSGPVEFLKKLNVTPDWAGFSVSYDVSEHAKGLAHIFYVGLDARTNKVDTIPLKTLIFEGDSDKMNFALPHQEKTNTIVIRTEDFAGYIVEEKIYYEVEAYLVENIDPSGFVTYDPANVVLTADGEWERQELGWKYLFDGDKKGENNLGLGQNDDLYRTFAAGPNAVGKPLIIDLGKAYNLAKVQIYSMLNTRMNWPSDYSYPLPVYSTLWNRFYYNKMPCDVSVYVSNDKDNESSWVEYGRFKQDPDLSNDLRWCAKCASADEKTLIDNKNALELADPIYMSINFVPSDDEYRYVKIVVNKVFNSFPGAYWTNPFEYISFHELEIYRKK